MATMQRCRMQRRKGAAGQQDKAATGQRGTHQQGNEATAASQSGAVARNTWMPCCCRLRQFCVSEKEMYVMVVLAQSKCTSVLCSHNKKNIHMSEFCSRKRILTHCCARKKEFYVVFASTKKTVSTHVCLFPQNIKNPDTLKVLLSNLAKA